MNIKEVFKELNKELERRDKKLSKRFGKKKRLYTIAGIFISIWLLFEIITLIPVKYSFALLTFFSQHPILSIPILSLIAIPLSNIIIYKTLYEIFIGE